MENKVNIFDLQKTERFLLGFILLIIIVSSCTRDNDVVEKVNENKKEVITGSIPEVVMADVEITNHATKIEQIVGDIDRQHNEHTRNQTFTRYGLRATDLGVPFQYGDTTFILFGDTWGSKGGLPNVMAFTDDSDPEDGLSLDFIEDDDGLYHSLHIPGISQKEFEVPTEGVMVNDQMYIYHTTDHTPQEVMGRSVLARAKDDGGKTFEYLYNFSTRKFINISIVQDNTSNWELLPAESEEDGLIIFGTGKYRESHVYMAYQPAAEIEDASAIRYFAGMDETGNPLWAEEEAAAVPVFGMDNPCVGEFSVSYNKFIDKWVMLYNCNNPRGINLRTADTPWGSWSEPQIVFHPWEDKGYCNFMHVSWQEQNCDNLHDQGRENVWGGEYGPYQFEHFATGGQGYTRIYFTMSTWNPYTVVLMKMGLKNSSQ
ncbi:DUF4185 domain-containing protein [Salegentibacter sp. F14]